MAEIKPMGNLVDNAWKGKNPKPEEWLRDEESAHKGVIFTEEAEYGGDIDHEEGLGRVATYFSTRTGKRFDISTRLAPKRVKPGELVTLTVLGCCNIIGIQRKSNKQVAASKKLNGDPKKGNKKNRRRKKVSRHY